MFALVALLVLLASADASSSIGQLTGRVVDEHGDPVAGASVRQLRERTVFGARTGGVEGVGEPATTDEDGRYTIERGGMHVFLEASAPGRTTARTPRITIEKGKPDAVVDDLVLVRATPFVGVVVSDDDGEPAPNAMISLIDEADLLGVDRLDATFSCQPHAEIRHAVTDATGRFEVDGLGERPYRVVVWAEEHLNAAVRRDPGVDALEIRLRRTDRSTKGTVVGPNGRGVQGAEVVAYVEPDGGIAHRVTGQSDEDGSFELRGMIDEPYTLRVTAPGMTSPAPATARPGGDPVTLELVAWARIEGRVVDANGQPALFAVVVYRVTDAGLEWHRQASHTEAPGSFSVSPLRPGRYVLEARQPSGPSARSEPITIELGTAIDDLELRLPPKHRPPG